MPPTGGLPHPLPPTGGLPHPLPPDGMAPYARTRPPPRVRWASPAASGAPRESRPRAGPAPPPTAHLHAWGAQPGGVSLQAWEGQPGGGSLQAWEGPAPRIPSVMTDADRDMFRRSCLEMKGVCRRVFNRVAPCLDGSPHLHVGGTDGFVTDSKLLQESQTRLMQFRQAAAFQYLYRLLALSDHAAGRACFTPVLSPVQIGVPVTRVSHATVVYAGGRVTHTMRQSFEQPGDWLTECVRLQAHGSDGPGHRMHHTLIRARLCALYGAVACPVLKATRFHAHIESASLQPTSMQPHSPRMTMSVRSFDARETHSRTENPTLLRFVNAQIIPRVPAHWLEVRLESALDGAYGADAGEPARDAPEEGAHASHTLRVNPWGYTSTGGEVCKLYPFTGVQSGAPQAGQLHDPLEFTRHDFDLRWPSPHYAQVPTHKGRGTLTEFDLMGTALEAAYAAPEVAALMGAVDPATLSMNTSRVFYSPSCEEGWSVWFLRVHHVLIGVCAYAPSVGGPRAVLPNMTGIRAAVPSVGMPPAPAPLRQACPVSILKSAGQAPILARAGQAGAPESAGLAGALKAATGLPLQPRRLRAPLPAEPALHPALQAALHANTQAILTHIADVKVSILAGLGASQGHQCDAA